MRATSSRFLCYSVRKLAHTVPNERKAAWELLSAKLNSSTPLRNEQAAWEALLDEIGEAHMTQPEVAGGWSIKDIVAHLTGWRRRSVRRFQALLKHEPDFSPPWPPELREDDEINAWIYQANCNRSLAEVLSESRDVFQQLVVAFGAIGAQPQVRLLRSRAVVCGDPHQGSLIQAAVHV